MAVVRSRSRSRAAAIASSRVSPATNREATARPGRVAVASVTEPRVVGEPQDRRPDDRRGERHRSAPVRHRAGLRSRRGAPRRTRGSACVRRSGRPMDQPGIEVLGDQRVLEALGEPIHHRGEHLDVHVAADLAAPHAVLHELERSVRILAAHEPVDRTPQAQAGVVAADHGDPVRHPVLPAELLGPVQPPVEGRPEAALHDVLGRVQPRREAGDGSLVRREEQPFLAWRSPGRPCPWPRRPRWRCPRHAPPR